MDIIDLLAGDSFIIYNKQFAQKYGVESAILLGAMCSYQKGFKNEEFYREQEKILEDTSLSLYGLRNATKKLQELGVLEIKKKGLPAKHYYKINSSRLCRALEYISTRPCENDRSCDIENNSTINNNKDNNNLINIYTEIVSYLNEKANTNYKASTPKTQTLIRARIKEGFDIDDFKRVIDNKCNEWLNTEWEKYLRPETLFGNKFESYLNSKKYINKSKVIQHNYTEQQMNSLFDNYEEIEI